MTAAPQIPNYVLNNSLNALLEMQKTAFSAHPMPSAEDRIYNLDKLHNALVDYKELLINAVSLDFGSRSRTETLLTEIYATFEGIAYNRDNLRKWMKPQWRKRSLSLFPSRVQVMYQPLGVVGIVVPWNFPIFLGLSPLVGALAAGNRAMIKTSEFAPATSKVIKEMLNSVFSEAEVAIVEGDVSVSSAFTKLPFDHLVFTGATAVGKSVMAAAAQNLTPLTLELGGKSPAIIHEEFPIAVAASRIAFGKCMNAGQICVSPDYVLCPEKNVSEFVAAFSAAVKKSYPAVKHNTDYTAIINDRQYNRLTQYLEDARAKGATVIEINPADENMDDCRKILPHLILNATEEMRLMKEEIFGPILPIVSYERIHDALQFVNEKPRPLALYYFDYNRARANHVLENTHSGGVCVNDTLSHVTADDIPFGGIGPSGMGHYHGKEGFLNFSKAKGVVRKGRIDMLKWVGPPWNKPLLNAMLKMQERRFRKRKL